LSEQDVRAALRRLGINVEAEMARYVARNLERGQANSIAVIGGDARTGVPIRAMVPLDQITAFANSSTGVAR
jgi:hypothetical protein